MEKNIYALLLLCIALSMFLACNRQPESTSLEIEANDEYILDRTPQLSQTIADTVVARVYLDSARQLLELAEHRKALSYIKETLRIYQYSIGPRDTLTAKALNVESNIYWNIFELDTASWSANKALSISLEVLGGNNLIQADAFYNLGVIQAIRGSFPGALNYLKKSTEITLEKRGTDNPRLAGTYANMGVLSSKMGEYDQAIAYYEKAIPIFKKTLGENHLNLASTYNNMGLELYNKGAYDKALIYYNMALNVRQNNSNKNNQALADLYNNVGNVLYEKGNLELAIRYHEQALLNRSKEPHPRKASSYHNIGMILFKKNKNNEALEYFGRALSIKEEVYGKEHPNLISTYQNIGNVWAKLGISKNAFINLNQALNIALVNFGPDHSSASDTYHSLGQFWFKEGNYTKALEYYNRAQDITAQNISKRHPELAETYQNKGEVFLGMGDLDFAYNYFQLAGDILSYDFDEPKTFSKVSDLGILKDLLQSLQKYYEQKLYSKEEIIYLDSLRVHFQSMIALEEYFQKEYMGSSTRQFYAARSIPIYEGAIANLLQRNRAKEIPETFLLAEKTKSRQLSEKIQSAHYTSSLGIPRTLREKEYDLNTEINYFENRKFTEAYETSIPNDSLLNLYEGKIFHLRNQRDSLLTIFKNDYPKYYNLRYSQQVVSIQGVQDSLLQEGNQALVEYFVGDNNIYTFTILPDTFYVQDIPIDFPLEQWVQDMRCGISSGFVQDSTLCGSITDAATAQKHYTRAAHQLYQKIFAPVDSLLPDNSQVIIVPDGVLGYLPFDALLTKAPEEEQATGSFPYLLRDHTLSYAYSATLQKEMKFKQHKHKPRKNLLAIAPRFDSQTAEEADTSLLTNRFIDTSNRRSRLSSLQFNIPEAEAIGELVRGKVITGSSATEDAFIQEASDYRLLHLSTHGKANDQVGDYSFLAFHYLDDSLENEWLYNRELYNLNLNADMVVLSACETGIGELQRGEGIISLARGFSYAGAKSIVTSLWSVNDQSTKVLMVSFYQNLKKGMPKDEALRQAKLDYLENNPNLGQEPFFWAAFIPIGDMATVVFSNGLGTAWWIGGATLLFILLFWVYRRKKIA